MNLKRITVWDGCGDLKCEILAHEDKLIHRINAGRHNYPWAEMDGYISLLLQILPDIEIELCESGKIPKLKKASIKDIVWLATQKKI
jgi:hypothetical protein